MTILRLFIALVAGFSIFVFGVTFEHYKYPLRGNSLSNSVSNFV